MGAFDQRPRFFEGQYLSAADLSAVVDYLRGAQARQALGAHTWGIGLGLNLIENPAPGAANRREVILQPGWARDGFCRQLVVQQPTRLAESLFAALPYNAAVDGGAAPVGRLVKVWLAYTETGGRLPAPGFEVCDLENGTSRIEEGFEFVIGELPLAEQRDRTVIGAETIDALDALKVFNPTAPPLHDTSVPHQTFPAGDKPPRWLVPVGQVRWVAGNGVLGYFVDRYLVPSANVDASIRGFRRYGGCVVQNIEASDGAIVLRARGDDPATPHRFAHLLSAGQPLATLLQDLVWVEGGLRCEGDAKLAGSRLLLRNIDGLNEGNELYLARAGDGSGLPGQRELRAVIGSDARTDNRFVVGPELAAAPAGRQAPQLVVLSSGRVGVNMFDPGCTLHARGDAIRLEDGAGAKRIEMRSDGPGVELRSDTNRLYLRSTGPAAQNNNCVIINPTPATDGRVGIGVDNPQTGLDVHEDSVGFSLDRGNGGRLVLRSAADAASRDKVFLEASVPAGGTPAPELRATGPAGVNLPLFSAYADTTYLRGKLGVNQAVPAADTQVHVRGTRIRLQSIDGSRSVDLRADGGAVDLQSNTNDLYLRSTNPGAGAPRNILMNPYAGDGNVGIGLDAPTEKLHVHGHWLRVDGTNNEQCVFGGDGHNAVTVGTLNPATLFADMRNTTVPWGNAPADAGAWLQVYCRSVIEVSDARAKTEVHTISGALAQVAQLRGVRYQWAAEGARAQDGERLGLIAQELQQVVPQAVTTGERGAGISYSSLVPLLIEAIKELREQVQGLQAEVKALHGDTAVEAPPTKPTPKRRGKQVS
ncbi:tail fiber domain-containing protein [Variovorax sp. J22R24]|uniref:tail fiber domain-containing protein n=1 Tax=Variovorax gracilis TaxID=3053502 RepID=UPI002574D803|nr:tail fiber domain-containing protein [Variovorax sp. J22R24]MDM0109634.1 tail fiber domain-containing protein [Variovorax sp. J22R24]